MNHKLLLPSYRARQRWLLGELERLAAAGPIGRALDLGAGEGEADRVVAPFVGELLACDVDAGDVETARALNADLPNVSYAVEDAHTLSYEDASFDLVVCLEVIEHVAEPRRVLGEIRRVLRPGGLLLLSCPSRDFPATYDPVNRVLRRVTTPLPFGAYGFGHSWLVDDDEMRDWMAARGLRVQRVARLSHHLVGLAELYLPGLLQRALKGNSGNTARDGGRSGLEVVPDRRDPPLLAVTDGINALDEALFSRSARSIGLAYVATREG